MQPWIFDRRLFRSKVVSIETNQILICWKILSLAVDKRTKNHLCMHWVSVFIINSSIETFASIELTFGFDRMNFRSKQPSIELTRYHSILTEIFVICWIETVDPVAELCLTNQIYSVLLNTFEFKEITEAQTTTLKCFFKMAKRETWRNATSWLQVPDTTVRAS